MEELIMDVEVLPRWQCICVAKSFETSLHFEQLRALMRCFVFLGSSRSIPSGRIGGLL